MDDAIWALGSVISAASVMTLLLLAAPVIAQGIREIWRVSRADALGLLAFFGLALGGILMLIGGESGR
jgi:hypothetical protein